MSYLLLLPRAACEDLPRAFRLVGQPAQRINFFLRQRPQMTCGNSCNASGLRMHTVTDLPAPRLHCQMLDCLCCLSVLPV